MEYSFIYLFPYRNDTQRDGGGGPPQQPQHEGTSPHWQQRGNEEPRHKMQSTKKSGKNWRHGNAENEEDNRRHGGKCTSSSLLLYNFDFILFLHFQIKKIRITAKPKTRNIDKK